MWVLFENLTCRSRGDSSVSDLFKAFTFACCDAEACSIKKNQLSTSDSVHRQVQLPLSRVGVAPRGCRVKRFPPLCLPWLQSHGPEGNISSRLLQVSLRNSGAVGDVSESHKAEGYCSYEF